MLFFWSLFNIYGFFGPTVPPAEYRHAFIFAYMLDILELPFASMFILYFNPMDSSSLYVLDDGRNALNVRVINYVFVYVHVFIY